MSFGKIMSRIGKQPIVIGAAVTVAVEDGSLRVKGPHGELGVTIPEAITVNVDGSTISIERHNEDRQTRALHGLIRSEIANAITGVTLSWKKILELSGVGYRAAINGQALVLTIGFSHPVTVEPPEGITFAVTEGKVVITGVDKRAVGQTAATIRAIKKPEPYKGKGIKYAGEHIRKKAGKSAKAVGGAPGAK